jgi:dienelactone hydrolase
MSSPAPDATAGPMTPPGLALSPSAYHQQVMDGVTQSHAWTGGPLRPWQNRLRRKLRTLIGADYWPRERVPLQVRSIWRREVELGVIEKIAFTSEPGAEVLAYLCLPKNAKPPYTWCICLQGHTSGMHHSIAVSQTEEAGFTVAGDRDFGLGCMARGVAALCLEQRSFGERGEKLQKHRGTHPCHDAVMRSLMLGSTLVGERVFDVDRAIDYLLTRPDCHPKRIGVMGNSGGGTVTIYSAALLSRLAFAMPSCAFCNFRQSILNIHHCGDNYVPGLYRVAECGEVLGLLAPRPVVVVAGRHDEIFPLAGVTVEFEKLQRIYAAAQAADQCQLVIGAEGHRFYAGQGWSAMLPLLA